MLRAAQNRKTDSYKVVVRVLLTNLSVIQLGWME